MNSLYTIAQRQTASVNADLASLDQSIQAGAKTTSLYGQINASLAGLSRTVEDYDSLARREVGDEKRQKALIRAKRVRDDFAALKSRLESLKQQEANKERESLFQTSSAFASSSRTAESPFSSNRGHYRGHTATFNSPPTMLDGRTNYALNENSFISSTSATLDIYLAQGQAILGNMTEQRDMLKGTRKRLLDAANTLGLSRNTISFIERRTRGDLLILIFGAIGTFVCFFLILKYLG